MCFQVLGIDATRTLARRITRVLSLKPPQGNKTTEAVFAWQSRLVVVHNFAVMATEVHKAIVQKDLKKLKKLLTKKSIGKLLASQDQNGQTPLLLAVKNNDYDVVEALLPVYASSKTSVNIPDKGRYTPLHLAVQGDERILHALLKHEDVDVNFRNEDDNTPLHYFCAKFRSPNVKEPFTLFMDKKVNINAQNKNGETPLHKAIFNTSVRLLIADLLVNNGASVNILNQTGETPLHYAVWLGREDLVDLLLQSGADVTIKGNKLKKTPLELALEEKNKKITNKLKNAKGNFKKTRLFFFTYGAISPVPSATELLEWLQNIQMEQYFGLFVKEGLFKEVLPDVGASVLDKMGITKAGDRIVIMKGFQQLKGTTGL